MTSTCATLKAARPLLLGKAKDNNASSAIGPFVRLFDTGFTIDDARQAVITVKVIGTDGFVMEGSSSMSKISRDPLDLAGQALNATHQYPDGFMLFCGTMFAPVQDREKPGMGFTHHVGDAVSISSPKLGTLWNRVDHSDKIAPWTFGISAPDAESRAPAAARMTESVDAVVVGAGVIGLAIARRLARDGREVIVLERHDAIGSETSARNSEVIHAGIYNLPRRLKSTLCVAGRAMLYRYCAEHGVPHARTGKLIVAVEPSEIPALAKLKEQGEQNGVDDLVWLTGDAAMVLETQPRLRRRRAFAFDRDHRRPSVDAGAARRSRSRRQRRGAERAGGSGRGAQ